MMLIVVPPKGVNLLLRVLQRREPVHVQTLVSEPAVERFNRGVVGGFAATAEVEDHAVRVRLVVQCRAEELRSIVQNQGVGTGETGRRLLYPRVITTSRGGHDERRPISPGTRRYRSRP